MEPQQLLELANNAELDHWPPHLGVTTDAQKVEYLAARLREAAESHSNELEAAKEREESLEDDNLALENEVDSLEEKNEKLKDEIAELKAKLV